MDGPSKVTKMTKTELNKLIAEEMQVYGITKKNIGEKRFRHQKSFMIWRAVKRLRIYEYRCAKRDSSKNALFEHGRALFVKFADRRLNKACEKVDIELTPGMIGKRIRICHDNVVINGKIGEGCIFHGNNVVGNKRTGASAEIPRLGNRVDVGYGAIIIGDIEIADNCIIGAGAVVTKSFTKPGTVIAGVPAKEIIQRMT